MAKNPESVTYGPLLPEHFDAIIALGNRVQGDGYLNEENLRTYYELGLLNGVNSGHVAWYNHEIVGFRLTFAPGKWAIDKWCSPALWGVEPANVCYFKCNTVDPAMQGFGIGTTLLNLAKQSAAEQGAKAGLAHIWLASPGNSAFRYFSKNGGELIKEHPNKWREAALYEGYDCPVCPDTCECVAAEMLLKF